MAQPDIVRNDIILAARRRADMEDSTFVSDAEVGSYADDAWLEFWMLITSKFEDFFLKKTTITLTIGSSYSLPNDFLKLRGVRHAGKEFLRRLDIKELPALAGTVTNARPSHYYVHGDLDETNALLELVPPPNSAYSMELYYTPIKALLDVELGSLRLVALWVEYIKLSVAIKLKDKEESDCSVLIAEREMLLDLITKSMTPLDNAEPFAVIQTQQRASVYGDPYPWEEYLG